MTNSFPRVWLAENILNIRNSIFRFPNIWGLERLAAAILNIVHNAVSNKTHGIKSTFLVNPTAITGNTNIIIMFV